MKQEENKVNYDLSVLNLDELIILYENILEFLSFLNDKKIVEAEKAVESNE